MPSELLYTPPAEAQWIHLLDPRPQLDPDKPLAWTFNLLFPSDHQIFQDLTEKINAIFAGKKREPKLPWKPHQDREGIMVLKFKAVQLTRRDGTTISGPRVVDAKKQEWTAGNIGNGSTLRACYFIHPFDRPDGHGVTLIPKSVQVIKFVPISDGSEGFEEDENGYVQQAEEEVW